MMTTGAPNKLYVPSLDFWFNKNPGLAFPRAILPYQYHRKTSTVKGYMKSRTIKKHRAQFSGIINQIKSTNCVPLTLFKLRNDYKNKFKDVLQELIYAPPLQEGLFGGISYNVAKISYFQESN